MKKIFLAIISLLVFVGCIDDNKESSKDEPAKVEEKLDLAGVWKQVNSKSEDAWQEAEITEDTITVYWVSDNGDTKALYWAGTFEKPESNEDYSWDSENDYSMTENALMASGSETKTFEFKDEQISYEVTAFDITTTVRLERVEE